MESTTPKLDENDSPLEQKARNMRRTWFNSLPLPESDGIIKKGFDTLYPTDNAKRKALEGINSNYCPF